jgi:phytoene/squalene synthetase
MARKNPSSLLTSTKKKYDQLSNICSKNVTRTYSTSFSLGIRFIDQELRQPIHNIYGFVRIADEIVDSFCDYDRHTLLAEFKHDCFKAIDRGISTNPALHSFQHTVNTYGIDHELIHLFLASMEMDLSPVNFGQSQYQEYILGSAQVVGLMCLHIFVKGNKAAYERLKRPAMQLGSAFQKVNFLRDLGADYLHLGRSYFPSLDPSKFSSNDKLNIEKEISKELSQALLGIRQLPKSSGKGVYLAYTYYQQLFRKIQKRSPSQILSSRLRISNWAKFGFMIMAQLRYTINKL